MSIIEVVFLIHFYRLNIFENKGMYYSVFSVPRIDQFCGEIVLLRNIMSFKVRQIGRYGVVRIIRLNNNQAMNKSISDG